MNKKNVRYGKIFSNYNGEDYRKKILANQLIAVDDLIQFKKQLLGEFIAELKTQINIVPKKWLKSYEVRRLLKKSPETLHDFSSFLPFCNLKECPYVQKK